MDREKINKINVERLTRWHDKLNQQHSTPVLLLGVGHDHKRGQCSILVTEDMKDHEIILFLQKALQMAMTQLTNQG